MSKSILNPKHPNNAKKKRREEEEGGWRRGGDGWWYFPGFYRRAKEDDLLACKPEVSCICQVCSIVTNSPPCVHLCLLVFNLFSSSEQRSRQPSHSRAGLTSIGLEIERTPLSNQTSPRRAPSHSFKMSETPLNWTFPGSSRTDSGV